MARELDGSPVKPDCPLSGISPGRPINSRICKPAGWGVALVALNPHFAGEAHGSLRGGLQGWPLNLSRTPVRHGDPSDSGTWSRMASSGKGAQYKRNSHRYVPGPLPGKSGGSATSSAGQPACSVAGRTAPTRAPRTAASSLSPVETGGAPLAFNYSQLICRANGLVFFHQKTSCPGFPQIPPFPSSTLPRRAI